MKSIEDGTEVVVTFLAGGQKVGKLYDEGDGFFRLDSTHNGYKDGDQYQPYKCIRSRHFNAFSYIEPITYS